MLFVRVLFVMISNVIASPVLVDQYLKDPIFDSSLEQPPSAFGSLYVDSKFEVPSSTIPPLLGFDVSELQPHGLITAFDIVQNSQSPPTQTPDDSYTKAQAQFYQSFQCGGGKSVCCEEEGTVYLGQITAERCYLKPSKCPGAIYYPNCGQIWNIQIEQDDVGLHCFTDCSPPEST